MALETIIVRSSEFPFPDESVRSGKVMRLVQDLKMILTVIWKS